MKLNLVEWPRAVASMDFPVPGAPCRRTPLIGDSPGEKKYLSKITIYETFIRFTRENIFRAGHIGNDFLEFFDYIVEPANLA